MADSNSSVRCALPITYFWWAKLRKDYLHLALCLQNSCSYATYCTVGWPYVTFAKESKLNITQYLALCIQISWLGYQRWLSRSHMNGSTPLREQYNNTPKPKTITAGTKIKTKQLTRAAFPSTWLCQIRFMTWCHFLIDVRCLIILGKGSVDLHSSYNFTLMLHFSARVLQESWDPV